MDKGKATDVADAMVAAVPADKAMDWATQVSLKLQKWVSARNKKDISLIRAGIVLPIL